MLKHSNLDELGDPKERTPTSAKYTKKVHQKRFLDNDKVLHGFVPLG